MGERQDDCCRHVPSLSAMISQSKDEKAKEVVSLLMNVKEKRKKKVAFFAECRAREEKST